MCGTSSGFLIFFLYLYWNLQIFFTVRPSSVRSYVRVHVWCAFLAPIAPRSTCSIPSLVLVILCLCVDFRSAAQKVSLNAFFALLYMHKLLYAFLQELIKGNGFHIFRCVASFFPSLTYSLLTLSWECHDIGILYAMHLLYRSIRPQALVKHSQVRKSGRKEGRNIDRRFEESWII